MKIILSIGFMFILVAVAAYLLDLFPGGSQPSQNGRVTEVLPSTQTPTPPTVPSLTPTPTPSLAPPPIPSTGTSPSTAKDVKFEFAVTEISGSGLSRTISAQLTNVGTDDAHNIWGEVEVSSQESRIKLGGKDYLRIEIGTLKAGANITKEVTLEFTILDGLKIQQNGAKFMFTVYSDENTETLHYDYNP